MFSLNDIKRYQIEESTRIAQEAAKIHPKLVRRFGIEELFDDKINAEILQGRYMNEIKQQVLNYNRKVQDMCDNHMYEFISGWVNIHPDGHFGINKNNGEYLTSPPSVNVLDHTNEYIIRPELSDYWDMVNEMRGEYKIKPFWSYTFYLTHNGVGQTVTECMSAVDYIKYNRKKFDGITDDYEMLVELSEKVRSLPYKMALPPISRDMAARIRNDDLNSVVNHH